MATEGPRAGVRYARAFVLPAAVVASASFPLFLIARERRPAAPDAAPR